jgi:hypothetical protein
MNRAGAAVIVAAAGVFAAVYFLARDREEPAAAVAPAPGIAEPGPAAAPAPPLGAPGEAPVARPTVTDPRLAALMGNPGDDLVERIAGPDGRVIREVDADPNSAGYRKPLRDFSYAGDKVVAITAYKYFGDQTQIVRAVVSYKPDGSVDEYREDTRYENGKQRQSN